MFGEPPASLFDWVPSLGSIQYVVFSFATIFLPIGVSIVAMIAGWEQLKHRLLFVTVAMLVAFGVMQIVIDYLFAVVERAIWVGGLSFGVSEVTLKIKVVTFVLTEIVLVPLLLRHPFLVMKDPGSTHNGGE